MAQVSDLLMRIRAMQEAPVAEAPREPVNDLAALFLASQNAMSDILTRNFDAQIVAQCRAIVSQEMADLERRVSSLTITEAQVKAIVDQAISEIEMPEMPEMPEMEEPEDDEPKAITVQRKDGVIASVKVGDVTYDIVRNKQGLIKQAVPRGQSS